MTSHLTEKKSRTISLKSWLSNLTLVKVNPRLKYQIRTVGISNIRIRQSCIISQTTNCVLPSLEPLGRRSPNFPVLKSLFSEAWCARVSVVENISAN